MVESNRAYLWSDGVYRTHPEDVSRDEVIDVLQKCYTQFDFYVQEHINKNSLEKARINQEYADMCLGLLQKWEDRND